jgi:Zn finger protein HypA/HybF involved in hydrogenase expression
MEKTIKCKDCKTEFKTNPNARFPRKYCDKCSAERKKAYEKIDEIKFEECED